MSPKPLAGSATPLRQRSHARKLCAQAALVCKPPIVSTPTPASLVHANRVDTFYTITTP